MSRTARQPTPPSTVVRPRRQAIPPRNLDDFYVDYTLQRQPICSDDVQQIRGATGLELGEKPTSLVSDTGSRPELARDLSTGSIDRISLGERYQDLPQPQSQTLQVSNVKQRILNTSSYTAAIGGRPELPRDQDDLPQPIRALPVHARGDPLYSHAVRNKDIDYLADNLRELISPSSIIQPTPRQPLSAYGLSQVQPKLVSHDDLINRQPRQSVRQAGRPYEYYNLDQRNYNDPLTNYRDYGRLDAAVQFMPHDYSQHESYPAENRRPVSYSPHAKSQGYPQRYDGQVGACLNYACYERHSEHPMYPHQERPSQSYPDTAGQSANYSQPYHSRHPPPRNPYVEPSYRGPMPTIPTFCNEDPREFARLKIALENLLPPEATEHFKFQILVDHLKQENALLIADSYVNSRYPYTNTMRSLIALYGQPHQLALQRIAELMDGPKIKSGDIRSFRLFALKVRALVGMLDQLGAKGWTELECGSHVSRLLAKLPHDLRANFRRFVNPIDVPVPTLLDLSDWLEYELTIQEDESPCISNPGRVFPPPQNSQHKNPKPTQHFATVLHGGEQSKLPTVTTVSKEKPKRYCPFCNNVQHYFNQCSNFKLLNQDQVEYWLKENHKCFKCGRDHQISQCNLKAKCKKCDKRHLEILHDFNTRTKPQAQASQANSCLVSSEVETLYLDRPTASSKVLLKISRVILRNGEKELNTYAILDDGSERTMLLYEAAQQLKLQGSPEHIALRTVRQDIRDVHGAAVSFSVASVAQPNKSFTIERAFTAKELGLAKHTYPVKLLQKKYRHLQGLPIPSLHQAQPLLLIGSDYPHLITAIRPVRLGPPGGPAAVKTRLGWTLQGPSKILASQLSPQQCLFTSISSPEAELFSNVQKLWQMDTLPYRSEKLITRSKQDAQAVQVLEEKTVRRIVGDVQRYATPLLWKNKLPFLHSNKEAVTAHLRRTEKRLLQNTDLAAVYVNEVQKLEDAGYIAKVTPERAEKTLHARYIPHHIVQHNGKLKNN